MGIPDLQQKQVLITGAAAGIGYETALAFARGGANLVLTDINADALERAAADVRRLDVDCRTWTVDVGDEGAMQRLAEEVTAAVGTIDVLVNNAGIAFVGRFVNTPMKAWRSVLDINLMGVVHGCASFLPGMLEAGGARHIVNVASAAGLGPVGGLSPYVASKFAVVGLSETLAIELAGTPVGLTVVCPGVINTAIVQIGAGKSSSDVSLDQAERIQRHYQDHGCHPQEVAEQIVAAVRGGKGMITPGPTATQLYYARKLLPRRIFLKTCGEAARKIGYLA